MLPFATDQTQANEEMPNYMRLEAFRTTPLVTEPFQHLVVLGFIGPAALAEIKEFADRGPSLTIDHGWRDVAESVLAWLKDQGL